MFTIKVMGLNCQLIETIIINNLHEKFIKIIENYNNNIIKKLRHPRILLNDEDRGGRVLALKLFESVVVQIMRASLIITGFLSGWWCTLALIQLPPPKQGLIHNINMIKHNIEFGQNGQNGRHNQNGPIRKNGQSNEYEGNARNGPSAKNGQGDQNGSSGQNGPSDQNGSSDKNGPSFINGQNHQYDQNSRDDENGQSDQYGQNTKNGLTNKNGPSDQNGPSFINGQNHQYDQNGQSDQYDQNAKNGLTNQNGHNTTNDQYGQNSKNKETSQYYLTNQNGYNVQIRENGQNLENSRNRVNDQIGEHRRNDQNGQHRHNHDDENHQNVQNYQNGHNNQNTKPGHNRHHDQNDQNDHNHQSPKNVPNDQNGGTSLSDQTGGNGQSGQNSQNDQNDQNDQNNQNGQTIKTNNNDENIAVNYNYYQVSQAMKTLAQPMTNASRVIRSTRVKSDSQREKRKNCRRKNIGGACRGKNWCPDMDISNRAYLSPTLFEGKVRSMSSSRKPGSNYAVTFEVKQVYKSQSGYQPLRKNDSVRLHFRDKSPKYLGNKSSICRNDLVIGVSNYSDGSSKIGNESARMIDWYNQRVIRADIKRGKVYLVFVNRVGPRNFTILGEPVVRSKKNEQAVQAVVRPDYVREVTLSELRDSVARTRERVKLVCRTRGSPPPRVHWLKDGVQLNPRRGLKIQHKRRRSKLVIISARPEDSGRYECIAQSSSGYRASLAAQLLVVHDAKIPDTTTAAWPRQEQPCPIAGDFCMNGGTCLFFETVGEPACRCAEGFTGLRCETKDVISTGSVYNRHRAPFSCKLGLSTSYYC